MIAVPPNRSMFSDRQTRRSSNLLMYGILLIAVLTILIGAPPAVWSQSGLADLHSDSTQKGADQAAPSNADSQPSAIRFVAAAAHSEPVKAEVVQPQAPVVSNPTIAPPLAVADYENYIKGPWNASLAAIRQSLLPAPPQSETQASVPTSPKRLEAITAVTPLNTSGQKPDAQPPRVIAFAAPQAPAREESGVTIAEPQTTGPIADSTPICISDKDETDTAIQPQADNPGRDKSPVSASSQNVSAVAQKTSRSLLVSSPLTETNDETAQSEPPATTEIKIHLVESHTAVTSLAIVAQKPETHEPQSATVPSEAVHAPHYTESIPAGSVGDQRVSMTNSSYLPANPESYCFRCGVQCPPCGCNPGGPGWNASRPIPWEVFAQGEYVGPARLAHVPIYRLRVDDRLSFVFRLSGQVAGQPYRLNVRDRIQVQSLSAPEVINRELVIQPDGSVTLPLLGQVRVAGTTVEDLGKQLDEQFKRQNIKDPRITVTPLVLNSNLEELRTSVDRRYGAQGGLGTDARVSPDGTIQLPAIGSVPVQGLTLDELEREIKTRYSKIVEGLEVTPILAERAPRFLYVLGEVKVPGRFTMEGPTTLMQAIALAGSWNNGAQTNEVVVFRRDENWQLMATKVNIRSALLFKKPCPAGEIWLRDSDIVLVPKSPILCADDFIELVFTRGIYGVFPVSFNFTRATSL